MRLVVTAVLAFATLIGASRSTSSPELYSVTLPLPPKERIRELHARGFDIAGVNYETRELVILTDRTGLRQLAEIQRVEHVPSELVTEVSDTSYKNPADIERVLKDIEAKYPRLASVTPIGRSLEGRDILAVRITDRSVIPPNGKTVVLFDFMHHAREIMTPEVGLDMADYLTSRHSSDPKVKEWLRLNDIWIVPMVNPDGNNRVWTQDNMWRKNARGGHGVDNNRNYPASWNGCGGSSGNRFQEDYRGTGPGSEPENQALMSLATLIRPAMNISYHTASELIIYPYGCPNKRPPTALRPTIETVGRAFAAKLVRDSGNGTYRPGYCYDLLYPADGGSIDWMMEQIGALSYGVEVNSTSVGFQPSFSGWRDRTVEKQRPGWQFILDRVNQSAIRISAATGTKVRVESTTGGLLVEKTTDDKGWAHFVVNPGQYSAGKAGAMQTVSVSGSVTVVTL